MNEQENSNERDRRIFKRLPTTLLLMFRVKAPFEVHLQLGGKDVEAVAQDISVGGLGIFTNHKIPSGARVSVKFRISNDAAALEKDKYRTFELDGDVRYAIAVKEEMDYRLGIQFVRVSDADRSFITSYIRTNQLMPSKDMEGESPGPI